LLIRSSTTTHRALCIAYDLEQWRNEWIGWNLTNRLGLPIHLSSHLNEGSTFTITILQA